MRDSPQLRPRCAHLRPTGARCEIFALLRVGCQTGVETTGTLASMRSSCPHFLYLSIYLSASNASVSCRFFRATQPRLSIYLVVSSARRPTGCPRCFQAGIYELRSRVCFAAAGRMHATASVSPRRARATACGGMWTARRTPTGKYSLGAPSGLWEQLMHNEQEPRPMSATMGSTVSSFGTTKVPERLQTGSQCTRMNVCDTRPRMYAFARCTAAPVCCAAAALN